MELDHHVELYRRGSRRGFKAGNINDTLRAVSSTDDEWVVLVDADQVLPHEFLRILATTVSEVREDVAFIQGRITPHLPRGAAASSVFQSAMSWIITLFYERDLVLRASHGFMPFLGHGAAFRRSVWAKVGGFPELVSEDFAFAFSARRAGFLGVYAENLHSEEAYPCDYTAYIVRIRKFAGGTAEVLRRHWMPFVFSADHAGKAGERIDAFMLLAWYVLAPLALANAYLSAYVCHVTSLDVLPMISFSLQWVYLAMVAIAWAGIISVAPNLGAAVRYWFWASAVYTSAVPVCVWAFLVGLVRAPHFERTPKRVDEGPSLRGACAGTTAVGVVTCVLATTWPSPFQFVLFGIGISYLLSSVWVVLHQVSRVGRLARCLVYVPGLCFLFALWRVLQSFGL